MHGVLQETALALCVSGQLFRHPVEVDRQVFHLISGGQVGTDAEVVLGEATRCHLQLPQGLRQTLTE